MPTGLLCFMGSRTKKRKNCDFILSSVNELIYSLSGPWQYKFVKYQRTHWLRFLLSSRISKKLSFYSPSSCTFYSKALILVIIMSFSS